MSKSPISERVRALLGVESEPLVFDIEKGAIRRVAEAIEDPNTLWTDEEFAKKTRYGGIIASPTFITSLRDYDFLVSILEKFPVKRAVNGGNDIEYFQPIKAGDRITSIQTITHVRERDGGELGRMFVLIVEAIYKNQKGEVAVKGRTTVLLYMGED